MTTLYSKETELLCTSSVMKTFWQLISGLSEQQKEEIRAVTRLIDNGNEVMEYLIMVDRTLCANGAYNASTVTRELIKKIKGEG